MREPLRAVRGRQSFPVSMGLLFVCSHFRHHNMFQEQSIAHYTRSTGDLVIAAVVGPSPHGDKVRTLTYNQHGQPIKNALLCLGFLDWRRE